MSARLSLRLSAFAALLGLVGGQLSGTRADGAAAGEFRFGFDRAGTIGGPAVFRTALVPRPGDPPVLTPTALLAGTNIAFPAVLPAEPLTQYGLLIHSVTATNDGQTRLLHYLASPVAPPFPIGADRHDFEPVPLHPALTAPFAPECAAPPVNAAAIALPPADDETPEEKAARLCPNGDCTEFARKTVEQVAKAYRRQGLNDEADLLEEMLRNNNLRVDTGRDFTRPGDCSAVLYRNPFLFPGVRLVISPDLLCKTNAAGLLAVYAGAYAIQWESDELGSDTVENGEVAVLLMISVLLKDALGERLAELKKIFEALRKIILYVEAQFPAFSCIIQTICDASAYTGDNDSARDIIKRLRENLRKLKAFSEHFEHLTPEQRQQYLDAMEARLRLVITFLKSRNWAALEALGIPRGCTDPILLRFADAFDLSTLSSPGRPDTSDADHDGIQDVMVPLESEETILVVARDRRLGFGDPQRVPIAGGPHRVVGFHSPPNAGSGRPLWIAGVATREQGAQLLRRDADGFSLEPLATPPEVIDLIVGDFNGDEAEDLAVLIGPAEKPGLLFLAQTHPPGGRPSFLAEPGIEVAAGAQALAAGDWNGDGTMDLAVVGPGFLQVLLQPADVVPGQARWVIQALHPGPRDPSPPLAGRLDGDVAMDLVLVDRQQPEARAWFGSANGLRPGSMIALPAIADHAALGDLDGEGTPELLAAERDGPRLFVLPNPAWDAAPTAVAAMPSPEPSIIQLPATARDLLLRDLDNDGDRDLLVTTAEGIATFDRLFARPTDDCNLRFVAARPGPTRETLVLESTPPAPDAMGLRLLHRHAWDEEWRPVPLDQLISFSDHHWIVRPPPGTFRLYRVMQDPAAAPPSP